MKVSIETEEGKKVCSLDMDTSPCLDLSFENNKKFYKITKVETVLQEDPDAEKTFNCTVKELTAEQHNEVTP